MDDEPPPRAGARVSAADGGGGFAFEREREGGDHGRVELGPAQR